MRIRRWQFIGAFAVIESGFALYQFYLHFFCRVAYRTPYAPYGWLAFVAIFAASAVNLYRIDLHALRKERGLCDGCGFDLRASVGRCPECGLSPQTALEAKP